MKTEHRVEIKLMKREHAAAKTKAKVLAKEKAELAEAYEGKDGVAIAKVDCTSDDNKNKKLCNDNGVRHFGGKSVGHTNNIAFLGTQRDFNITLLL